MSDVHHAPTPPRDEGLTRLEDFIAVLGATRERLGALQSELESEEQALERAQAEITERLAALNRTVTAGPRDLVETAFRAALSGIGAVTGLATEMASVRMVDGQRIVQQLEAILDQGVTIGRESLVRLSDHTRSGLEEVEHGSGDMHSSADEGDEDTATRVAEMQERMDTMRAALAESGAELERLLQATDSYLANALAQYMSGIFDVFRAHLALEAQPYLVDSVEAVIAGVARGHDDLRMGMEDAAARLEDSTERFVDDAHDRIKALLKEREDDEDKMHNESVLPLREELARQLNSLTDGNGVINHLQPLVPVLVTAKHVVDEIDDMMNLAIG